MVSSLNPPKSELTLISNQSENHFHSLHLEHFFLSSSYVAAIRATHLSSMDSKSNFSKLSPSNPALPGFSTLVPWEFFLHGLEKPAWITMTCVSLEDHPRAYHKNIPPGLRTKASVLKSKNRFFNCLHVIRENSQGR